MSPQKKEMWIWSNLLGVRRGCLLLRWEATEEMWNGSPFHPQTSTTPTVNNFSNLSLKNSRLPRVKSIKPFIKTYHASASTINCVVQHPKSISILPSNILALRETDAVLG